MCDMFPPAFGPRMGYLCKYLKLHGWNPVVITEYIEEDTFAFLAKQLNENKLEITYIRYYRRKGWKGKVEWGWTFLRDVLFNYKDKRIYREAMKIADKYSFDLILCSTYRTFPMQAAARFAQKKRLPLIIDLRDIIEQYTGHEFITHPLPKIFGFDKLIASLFRKRNLAIRNRILHEAVYVTTISPWHVSVLSAYNKNTKLIYNGYDPDIFYPVNKKNNIFFITYTGRIHSAALRDPDLLFQAIQRLEKNNIIDVNNFRMQWYVDKKSRQIIEKEVEKYSDISLFMNYLEYIPASKIPEALHESEILLLLTNKSDDNGPKGVMTTKLFESLAVGKPILCVRGDEGCIEEVINQTRSGLSAHIADEVYNFIKNHYLRWQAGLLYKDNSNKEEIKKYSRELQAEQFIEIFVFYA